MELHVYPIHLQVVIHVYVVIILLDQHVNTRLLDLYVIQVILTWLNVNHGHHQVFVIHHIRTIQYRFRSIVRLHVKCVINCVLIHQIVVHCMLIQGCVELLILKIMVYVEDHAELALVQNNLVLIIYYIHYCFLLFNNL